MADPVLPYASKPEAAPAKRRRRISAAIITAICACIVAACAITALSIYLANRSRDAREATEAATEQRQAEVEKWRTGWNALWDIREHERKMLRLDDEGKATFLGGEAGSRYMHKAEQKYGFLDIEDDMLRKMQRDGFGAIDGAKAVGKMRTQYNIPAVK